MTLAEKIKLARVKSEMTQREVASLMGISQQAYGQYESGKREPKLETVARIANALNVSVSEFIPYGHPQNMKARYEAAKQRAEQYAKQTTREKINSGLDGLNETGEEYILQQIHFARHIQEYCKPGIWTPAPIHEEESSPSNK